MRVFIESKPKEKYAIKIEIHVNVDDKCRYKKCFNPYAKC